MLYAFFWVIPRRLKLYTDISEHSACSIFIGTYLPVKIEQSVPKRRYINFRRWGNTQKKAYNNS
jgi:hypothetical protein